MLPRALDEYRELVDELAKTITTISVDRARAALRELGYGEIRVNATADEIRLEGQDGALEAALLRAAGHRQEIVVAGVGFEPTTFGL